MSMCVWVCRGNPDIASFHGKKCVCNSGHLHPSPPHSLILSAVQSVGLLGIAELGPVCSRDKEKRVFCRWRWSRFVSVGDISWLCIIHTPHCQESGKCEKTC